MNGNVLIEIARGYPSRLSNIMSDVEKYIAKRKAESEYFAKHFEAGYENFKIGFLPCQAQEKMGVKQEEAASKKLLHETPWEWYGAFKNDPTWGELFDDIERRRSSDGEEMFACR